MNIKLIERNTQVLNKVIGADTFKIPESSFLYMRIDVKGLTIPLISSSEVSDVKSKKVEIPEGKTPVICLNTGKAQFLSLNEKVELVVLDVNEITLNKGE